ncbi:oxidoreductase [Paraburkholderia elongata]|uniref:Oxidoreductase n=1 Tax=Paraburkholderia elongata TaxID=2675747 RepID=A0A972SKI6_9BURK|nr:oxidoreductase [Paraburkholderia elongata]NPT59113.1 oxidoreductase [Paraburkholderia elongata]
MAEAGYLGTADATSNGSDYNATTFLVWSILARVRTMQMVKVVKVTNAGGIAPVGFVDLLPLVNQLDGYNHAVPHGTIHQCPYFRLQGGANAIIIDPQVGDIGWAGFADRDISSVVANKGQANPGSKRMFSMADAVYFGGMLNGTPTQYIAFASGGITVVSPTKITLQAPVIEADASTSFSVNSPSIVLNGPVAQGGGSYAGNATYAGTLTVTVDTVIAGKSFIAHTHHENGAGSNTNPPN